MAEIIVSAVVTVLVEKITDELMNLARSQGIDSQLLKWKGNLRLIQAVLADAGQKQISETSVELWLHELRDLAYDIDDVLDDLATEAMRLKFNQESRANTSTSTSKVMMKMIPTCCTNFTPRNIKYGRKMSSKLDEISDKLQDLVKQRTDLGLKVDVVRPIRNNTRLEETSLVDESKIMGREEDREAMIGKLLGDEACNENVSIVSIVGMGGVGKTTLAKVLYNDDRVKRHFEKTAWVCVSEELDVFNISKAIFQAVTGENKSFANLDLLHVALKEALSKKRFLLVLDDVWNEDRQKWELLQSPFVAGAPGSKVIVTTRKTTVTSVMRSVEDYKLNVLSNEKALCLFAQYAIGKQDFEQNQTLKSHAEGIVKKCGRLPLALIALGTVLKRKTSEAEWEELLNDEIWNLPEEENGILPALRLSYYDMPSHLKQLFAYCSLIPKDYEFDKNELVLMWMAEGFLSNSKSRKSLESLGREYFEELKSRSFFQRSTYGESRCTMHDLINDLAKSVAGDFFFVLDDKMDADDGNQAFEKLRHFSFIGRRRGVYRKFKELQRATRLRTFLPWRVDIWEKISLSNADLDDLLPRLQFLRVLSLAHSSVTEIPHSIGNLKHLRYLNFSQNEIKCLPEQISDLYNLQSLLVSHCWKLCSLPVSFAKLKNLRHLDISDTPDLKKMPLGIGGLSSLQSLSRAIIEGPNDGFKISELKELPDLEGQLSIEGLHNVRNAGEAKDANLQQKKGLDELVLQWSKEDFDGSRNATNEFEVLNELRPHHMLRKMKIRYYGGTEFPSWVGSPSFVQLTELRLTGCRSCTHLPPLEHLRSLEVLELYDMECWEKWSTSDGTATSFPHLRRISVRRCPKLTEVSMPFPSLEELEFYDMNGLKNWSFMI